MRASTAVIGTGVREYRDASDVVSTDAGSYGES